MSDLNEITNAQFVDEIKVYIDEIRAMNEETDKATLLKALGECADFIEGFCAFVPQDGTIKVQVLKNEAEMSISRDE